MGTRAAFVVGIDAYPDEPLVCCESDAKRMHERLRRNADGSTNFECVLATTERQRVDRALLLEQVERILKAAADVALFYFAGHGGVDEHGGYLMAQDSTDTSTVVRMTDVQRMIDASPVREVVILLDCCSANTMGEGRVGRGRAVLREGFSILTAARDTAFAGTEGGQFTTVLCEALDGGAADMRGQVTVASAYAYIDESFGALDQRPELKAHVSRLVTLRRCEPAVPDAVLRRLPHWFPKPNAEYRLTPAHEHTERLGNRELEEIFGHLQKCRAAKLVEPVDVAHMYDAAIANGTCRLTPLGRHYRDLAATDKL